MGKGGSSPAPPPAPNYQESMRSILQSQIDLAPQVYEREAEYQPKYQQLESQIQSQTAKDELKLYGDLQPDYSKLEDAYTTSTQQNQLKGLQERAPDYVQAFKQAQGTAGIDSAVKGYAETTLADQMKQGFKLNPEEQRQLEQSTLSGYSARGTALGNQAGLANVLNRYQYVQGRQQNALSQATGIGQYLTNQSAAPLTSFYQQPMYANTAGGNTIQNSLASQQQAGAQIFNPESQVGMGSIYGAYNAQSQYAAGMAQAAASKSAGQSAMIGSIGGGLLIGGGIAIF
jgi:hypothetical protein